jgi:hypothetical protein
MSIYSSASIAESPVLAAFILVGFFPQKAIIALAAGSSHRGMLETHVHIDRRAAL